MSNVGSAFNLEGVIARVVAKECRSLWTRVLGEKHESNVLRKYYDTENVMESEFETSIVRLGLTSASRQLGFAAVQEFSALTPYKIDVVWVNSPPDAFSRASEYDSKKRNAFIAKNCVVLAESEESDREDLAVERLIAVDNMVKKHKNGQETMKFLFSYRPVKKWSHKIKQFDGENWIILTFDDKGENYIFTYGNDALNTPPHQIAVF